MRYEEVLPQHLSPRSTGEAARSTGAEGPAQTQLAGNISSFRLKPRKNPSTNTEETHSAGRLPEGENEGNSQLASSGSLLLRVKCPPKN